MKAGSRSRNRNRDIKKQIGGEQMAEIIASTYEIIEKLGSGGGGNVFLAYHLRLGKKVVLKADKRKITTRPELLRREVDILKDLSHPYIPRVYDFFAEGETVYTVMDYIEGESLDRPLKRGETFSQPQVILWAKELLEALCYLHNPTHGDPPRGFVHSDIKPANLMRTPGNDICLIDFNIALALGEDNVIGCSDGYASPEHYGLDFSSGGETVTMGNRFAQSSGKNGDETETMSEDETVTDISLASNGRQSGTGSSSGSFRKMPVVPDIRSDIYSTGATLYHLLSGHRPARNAKEVVPLSEKEFSPQLVRIITKAMNPNPDLRYQTAEEMLRDLAGLRHNDPRTRRLKRNRILAGSVLTVVFAAGISSALIGLKRMQTTESWLKLAEYSGNALAQGDTEAAIRYALEALPTETTILTPEYTAEAQRALAEALGVYDLSDGFKMNGTVELPSAPLYMEISPDGRTACCVYASWVAIFDTESSEILSVLPADPSALSEVHYLDDHTIIYSGDGGIRAYDIENKAELWEGEPATAIRVSEDGKTAAAVYKDATCAYIYDIQTGEVKQTVDFEGKHQQITVNDNFANPEDNLLAINSDGTMLGVSFSDGSLQILDLTDPEGDILLFDETSGYTHFEGGFYDQYFACSAAGASDSIFAVIDTAALEQTGGFESDSPFGVQTDKNGIYVQTENLLVKIHPVTGEQTPLVTTSETVMRFARSDMHTLIATPAKYMFFDKKAGLVSDLEKEYGSGLLQIAAGTALIGSMDSPSVRIMKYEGHEEAEVLSYDPSYVHDEARISADGNTVMLFRYDQFRIYDKNGEMVAETAIPDADQVYDQQFIREGRSSSLKVIYNDGTIRTYSASDGTLLKEEHGEKPDSSMYEEFFTDSLRITSPLHGTPEAYDRETDKFVAKLAEDAYLTYITQAGDRIIAQYVTAEGQCYGQLLDEKCEVLADLPYLCDVIGETLYFDYPTGNMRETRIYNINELISLAQKY